MLQNESSTATLESAAKSSQKPRVSLSREKILEVATRLFADSGYAAISIRDIASACQLSIPSIYHFFGDKENLYLACCHYKFAEASLHLRATLANAPAGVERVRQFTVALCEVLMHQHEFRRLLQREILREEQRSIDQFTQHHFREELQALSADIAELSDKDKALGLTFSIYAMVFGLVQLHRISASAGLDGELNGSPDSLARHVLSTVLPTQRW